MKQFSEHSFSWFVVLLVILQSRGMASESFEDNIPKTPRCGPGHRCSWAKFRRFRARLKGIELLRCISSEDRVRNRRTLEETTTKPEFAFFPVFYVSKMNTMQPVTTTSMVDTPAATVAAGTRAAARSHLGSKETAPAPATAAAVPTAAYSEEERGRRSSLTRQPRLAIAGTAPSVAAASRTRPAARWMMMGGGAIVRYPHCPLQQQHQPVAGSVAWWRG